VSELGDWSAIGGAAASAVAATAAWAAAWQSRAQVRASSLPHLRAQLLHNANTGCLDLAVENAGGALASGCSFWISTPRGHTAGAVGAGFLRAGEGAHIVTDIPSLCERLPTKEGAVVGCRDLRSFMHYWSNGEKHRIYRSWCRRPIYPGPEQAVRDLLGIEPTQGPPAGAQTVPLSSVGR
jgi:hypothetical protein